MAEGKGKRRWLRRLVVLGIVAAVVAVARDRQFARNEQRFAAPSG